MGSFPWEKLPVKVLAWLLILAGIFTLFFYDAMRGAAVIASGAVLMIYAALKKPAADTAESEKK